MNSHRTASLGLIVLVSCGSWEDEQKLAVTIVGEPVNEEAIYDAVATILGDSDMRRFSIWFSDQPVVGATGELASGHALVCTQRETIRIFLPDDYRHCVFHSSLVHELVHRFDRYVLETPCATLEADPHPPALFGEDGKRGGMVKVFTDILLEKWCSSPGTQPTVITMD